MIFILHIKRTKHIGIRTTKKSVNWFEAFRLYFRSIFPCFARTASGGDWQYVALLAHYVS